MADIGKITEFGVKYENVAPTLVAPGTPSNRVEADRRDALKIVAGEAAYDDPGDHHPELMAG